MARGTHNVVYPEVLQHMDQSAHVRRRTFPARSEARLLDEDYLSAGEADSDDDMR